MQIKRNITITLKTNKDADDKTKKRPVAIRVSFVGERIEIPTGVSVSLADWDAEAGKVRKNGSPAGGLSPEDANSILSAIRIAISDTFKRYEIQNETPSAAALKQEVLIQVRGKADPAGKNAPGGRSIKAAHDEYVNDYGPTRAWSKHTYQVFNTLWKDLNTFRDNISFADLNEKGLSSFLEWMRFKKKVLVLKRSGDSPDERGLKDSTVEKHLSTLKMFLRWADSRGYPVHPAYKTFRPRYRMPNNQVIYLTEEEIVKIARLDLTGKEDNLDRVRDVLLFCCYTGLRYSDVENLHKGDVHENHIEVTTIKTADSVRIELNNVSRKILDKYKTTDLPGDRALPVISNQKTNDLLKRLCRKAGIDTEVMHVYYKGEERREVRGPKWQFVSTHTGRRSFICNALAKGIQVHIVMKWTGHSGYATMKPYIDAVDSVRAKAMARFDDIDIFEGND